MDLENGAVTSTEFIPLNTRIREVEQGPDGAVYLLSNAMGDAAGAVWRLEPLEVRPASADGGRSGPGASSGQGVQGGQSGGQGGQGGFGQGGQSGSGQGGQGGQGGGTGSGN